ncbi:MAG: ATP-NAD kinase family protein [Thermoplasmatota archaeon]
MGLHIGLLVNPIAGMGGKVGLKGTDGVLQKAIQRGATPIAYNKTVEMLDFFLQHKKNYDINWYTAQGDMGEHELSAVGITNYTVIYSPSTTQTTAEDTKKVCQQFLKVDLDLLVFCGGDGTARDIFSVVEKKITLLGIPSGVKMYSGVFGITASATAKILSEFISKRLKVGDVEIMDLDENRYRKGEWNIRLFGIAKGIVEPTYVQLGKMTYESVDDTAIKDELYEHLEEEIQNHLDYLYLFGPGGTIDYITSKLKIKNTLLGIDAVYKKKTIGRDVNETEILELLQRYEKAKVVLSPIGAQGFILGRGNLPLSARVIKKIGIENIIVVSTPLKIAHTPFIRVDTGDRELDLMFYSQGFIMVVIGYRLSRVVNIQTNKF